MDDTPESRKTKPEITLVSMFQKKFKAMEMTPALPNATQDSDRDGDGDEDSSSSSQNSQGTGMESGNSNADKLPLAENGQLVERDQLVVERDQHVKTEYDACLAMSLKSLRFLLRQGLDCCGQEERLEWDFNNVGNFIELIKLLGSFNEDYQKAVSENALEHYQITNHEVQKNLITACAKATTKLIVQDLGDDYFGILADGSHDKFHEYHLSLYLHYVDKKGMVIERFLGVVWVDGFAPESCKAAIDSLLKEHSLSPCKIRGQSYNGANNLAGNLNSDINGLKTLIMKDSQSAYHFHCFSHHIHLTLVNAAGNCADLQYS
ncbi:zinc finger MYM-type protein 1-like [Chenopodium quinoa]|uniref:zinc finger MYM-type protein 1-like n=1 Tax=Chenopodium quinoa TaxID=63459 RepID=UPI000B799472|nr:zinc finger MYM-type protein 1-like [Chenopodium quinoa]XP_021765835.1 zinc finger MYM-type protein 1-like [Chenopodium quinoa]